MSVNSDEITPSENHNWKKRSFWIGFLCFWLGGLGLAVLINIIVDPLDLYGSDLFEPFIFNKYQAKLDLFRELDSPPEALVFGSSRAGTVDPDTIGELTGYSTFNWALPSVKAESILKSIQIALDEDNERIGMIIGVIDPLVFAPGTWMPPQSQLVPEYSVSDEPENTHWSRENLKRLLTIEQFKASLTVLGRELGLISSGETIEYRPDGYAIYHEWERQVAEGSFNLEEVLDTRVPAYLVEALKPESFRNGLGSERKEIWREALDLCMENDIRVVVFMPPVHPRLWDYIVEEDADFLFYDTAEFLEQTVGETGGIFRDFTRIDSFGGSPDLFYDEVHLNPRNMSILITELFSDYEPVPVEAGN